MSFRDRMRVSPSNADLAVRIELQRRGLADKLEFESVVLLSGPQAGQVLYKEQLTKQMLEYNGERVRFTVPEAISGSHVFYLDGPPHTQRGVQNRDWRIDRDLTDLGYKPTRFSYGVPLSNQRKHDICDQIEGLLEG